MKIFMESSNTLHIQLASDDHEVLTVAEMLAAADNASSLVNIYSDATHQTTVSGATSLPIVAWPGQTVAPVRFYSKIPSSVVFIAGNVYYVVAVLIATDVSAAEDVQMTGRARVTAAYMEFS